MKKTKSDLPEPIPNPKQELAQAGFLSSEIDILTTQPIPKDTLMKICGIRRTWLEHHLSDGLPLDKYAAEVKYINDKIKEIHE